MRRESLCVHVRSRASQNRPKESDAFYERTGRALNRPREEAGLEPAGGRGHAEGGLSPSRGPAVKILPRRAGPPLCGRRQIRKTSRFSGSRGEDVGGGAACQHLALETPFSLEGCAQSSRRDTIQGRSGSDPRVPRRNPKAALRIGVLSENTPIGE